MSAKKLGIIAIILIPTIIIGVIVIYFNLPEDYTPGGPADIIKGSTIFDHNCTDISKIPAEWIDAVQEQVKLHYGHTSHGEQLTTGLTRIESTNATFSVAIDLYTLPVEAGAFCIADGQKGYGGEGNEYYVTPDLYWEGDYGLNRTRDMLDNQGFNFSMWCFCTQLDWYNEGETQGYLNAIATLESEYPDVIFIYMTGNAQATDADGYNRYLRNQYIRDYCKNNSKYLFDFADIDCWYNGAQSTYLYNNISVPVEHSQFSGDVAGHTTYESCELKGAVVWWMFARILGWAGP